MSGDSRGLMLLAIAPATDQDILVARQELPPLDILLDEGRSAAVNMVLEIQ